MNGKNSLEEEKKTEKQRRRNCNLKNKFYHKSIIFLSGANPEKIYEFPVFKDSQIGFTKYLQNKIIERVICFFLMMLFILRNKVADNDCQTDESDLEYAFKFFKKNINEALRAQRKKNRQVKKNKKKVLN